MDIATFLLVLNTIISILHPIKHIPQIIHTMQIKRTEDLSKTNIICEFGLNIMSLTSCILVYFYMGKHKLFLPVIIEKASSTIFITIIYILKNEYALKTHTYEEIKPINTIIPTYENKIENNI